MIEINVSSMKGGAHKCPRCWTYHHVKNFGHYPEEIAVNPELENEHLCDRCVKVMLEVYPDHPAILGIRAENKRQLGKVYE